MADCKESMPVNSKTHGNFPHVVRRSDWWKHLTIKCPLESGSQYYNCKGFFIIALFAICETYYAFALVDIGEYCSINDIGIFSDSEMGKLFLSKKMNLPDVESLANDTTHTLPFFFVRDEAFRLKPLLRKPYPGKGIAGKKVIFNYRLSSDLKIDRIPPAYS